MAASTSKPIASSSFYGENRSQLSESSNPLPATEVALPPYLSDPLLGPSKVWKIFRKQQDALDFISSSKLEGELLPFSYESVNYERLFLVAHPDIFWFRDCLKKPDVRNTYEIIASDAVCKLYFDLEFDPTLEENKVCDGNEMVKTFIRVVLYYMRKLFHVKYKMKDVLILDSTTAKKFSAHLIFQTPLVFRTNQDAGNFVRYTANELININNVCSDEEQMKFDIFKETTINIYAIKDLFVMNGKQTRVLFADLAVYSRNRLFRLYRSTKQGRNSPLLLSVINKFYLEPESLGSSDPVQYERGIFLASLITYFPRPPDPALVKEFEKPALNPNYSTEANLRRLEKLHSGQMSPTKTSPYPELDNYIRTRIQPKGTIYRNVHFPSTNVTVYDIKGYRYCGNIGRWHKSQNIKLIADVTRGVYYQKCHDVECATYKSPEWPLPPEILFKISQDEGDNLFENVEIDGWDTPCMKKRNSSDTPCLEKEIRDEPSCIEDNDGETCHKKESRTTESPCIEKDIRDEPSCIEDKENSDGETCHKKEMAMDSPSIKNRRENFETVCEDEDRDSFKMINVVMEPVNVRIESEPSDKDNATNKLDNVQEHSRCPNIASSISKNSCHKQSSSKISSSHNIPSTAQEKSDLNRPLESTLNIRSELHKEKILPDSKILPLSIAEKEDQEMVLDYVRNCEKKVLQRSCEGTSKSIEPVVKKLKL